MKEGLVRAKKLQASTSNQAGYFWVVDNEEFRGKLERAEEQYTVRVSQKEKKLEKLMSVKQAEEVLREGYQDALLEKEEAL